MQTQHLKALIANGRLDKAIEELAVYTQPLLDQSHRNTVAQLSARWKANERANSLGTLSNSEYTMERNKINQAVLALVDELADSSPDMTATSTSPMSLSTTPVLPARLNFWKKVGYVGLVLGILASLAKIIEFCNRSSNARGDAMQLTVYVQGTNSKPITELQNNGKIIVDFGNDRRAPLIGENGRTNLGEIPEKFRGEKIAIVLQAEGYEPAEPARQYIMDGKPVYFLVQRDNSLGLVQGIVKDRSGEHFIEGALVMIDQDTTVTTDGLGRFKVVLPLDKQRDTYTITVKKEGYKVKSEYFKPKTGPIEIRMDK